MHELTEAEAAVNPMVLLTPVIHGYQSVPRVPDDRELEVIAEPLRKVLLIDGSAPVLVLHCDLIGLGCKDLFNAGPARLRNMEKDKAVPVGDHLVLPLSVSI